MQYLSNDGSVIAGEEISSGGSTTYLYNKDIQNSTKSLLNADGDGITAYDYSDFGETTITGNQNVGNEVAYTGGIYDESTGLYYLNARYYDPEDGRFLSEDTYRGETNNPDTWHLYAYCANNPINYTDPSGHLFGNWDMFGRYWFDRNDNKRYGKGTTVYRAKSNNKYIKKYRSAIKQEDKYMNKVAISLTLTAIKVIISANTIGKVTTILTSMIKDKVKRSVLKSMLGWPVKKIFRLTTGGNLIIAGKNLYKAHNKYKDVKKLFPKIKGKKIA